MQAFVQACTIDQDAQQLGGDEATLCLSRMQPIYDKLLASASVSSSPHTVRASPVHNIRLAQYFCWFHVALHVYSHAVVSTLITSLHAAALLKMGH